MESRLSVAELRQATDSVVVALACAGDDGAFAELLRRRQSRVRKFMYHLCRQSAHADDLAQLVFVKAWRSLHQLHNTAAFDGWLKRIMVTTWLEDARRAAPANAGEEFLDSQVHHDLTAVRLDLDGALATLPTHMRLCVVLAYNEGLSHADIAALTGLPLGTVKSHVARGAARLRQVLADYGDNT